MAVLVRDGQRLEGHVGLPLPSVSARVVDEATGAVVADGETGELRLKGPGIFAEYFNNPEATEKVRPVSTQLSSAPSPTPPQP